MSLAMTRFGPRIVPITSPTPGECANYYATDAVTGLIYEEAALLKNKHLNILKLLFLILLFYNLSIISER